MEASSEGMRALWLSLAVLGATAADPGGGGGAVRVGGAARRHPAQRRRRADRGAARDRLHRGQAPGDPSLHVRLRAGRGPGGDRDRRLDPGVLRARGLRSGDPPCCTRSASPTWARWRARRWSGSPGNELVARYRIRVGREIGSAALVADGLHARTDGLTSLAVLAGAGGVALGWNWADPVVGLVITVAILAVLYQAAREVYRRLMDAVDPALVDQAERTLRATSGVLDTGLVRLRWVGHQLHAECEIIVERGHHRDRGPRDRRQRRARPAARAAEAVRGRRAHRPAAPARHRPARGAGAAPLRDRLPGGFAHLPAEREHRGDEGHQEVDATENPRALGYPPGPDSLTASPTIAIACLVSLSGMSAVP